MDSNLKIDEGSFWINNNREEVFKEKRQKYYNLILTFSRNTFQRILTFPFNDKIKILPTT